MINIKEEIQILLLKNGLSMRKLIRKMEESGYETCSVGGFSKMLKTKSIKFEKVQEILDFLGYKIKIEKK
jgi:phosphoribosyl-dephospho-CoA transferase